MAISYGNTSNSATGLSNNFTWVHNSNKQTLVVTVYSFVTETDTTVTYNGVDMDRIVTTAVGGGSMVCEIFLLQNPTTGSNTVSVTGTGNLSGGSGLSVDDGGTALTVGYTGTSSAVGSVTLSGTPRVNSVTIDSLFYNVSAGTPSIGAGQTLWGSVDLNVNLKGRSSREALEYVMDWGSLTGNVVLAAAELLSPLAPIITTGSKDGVFSTTAGILGSNVSDEGTSSLTERGVVVGLSSSPTTANTKFTTTGTTGSFNITMSGLTPETLYYARAFATSSVGTSYGSEISFKTDKNVAGTIINLDNPVIYS